MTKLRLTASSLKLTVAHQYAPLLLALQVRAYHRVDPTAFLIVKFNHSFVVPQVRAYHQTLVGAMSSASESTSGLVDPCA